MKIYDNGIRTFFNTKGVLKEKMFLNRFNIWAYASMTHLILTMVLTFTIISNTEGDIEPHYIMIPLWGLVSYAFISNETYSNVKYILLTLPYFIWLNIYTYIFILKYRSKYPNIDATDPISVERYIKIKKLTKKMRYKHVLTKLK